MKEAKVVLLVLIILQCCSLTFAVIINIPDDQPTIQGGINIAVDADTVLIQSGTYFENINFNGKNITVASLYLTTQDTAYISQTIIDGNQNGSVIVFNSGETSNANLVGLTIQNGLIPSWSQGGFGGGVRIDNATPKINNLIIRGNTAYRGGGIYTNSSAIIKDITLKNNVGEHFAGGIEVSSNIILENILIFNNTGGQGGAVHIYDGADVTLLNCTIEFNIGSLGNGVFVNSSGNATIINSIIRDNSSDNIRLELQGPPSTVSVYFSDIGNGESGIVNPSNWPINYDISNIDEDPLFVDSVNYDFHLTVDSPCIDTGDPNSTPDPDGTISDMGMFYYNQNQPLADFTANMMSGTTNLIIDFSDISTLGLLGNPIIEWNWDFDNDGTIDSNDQYPQWTYYVRGNYTVSLTVFDGTFEDTETKEDYIELLNSQPIVQNPIDDFSFDEDTSNSNLNLNNVFDDLDIPYGDELSFSYSGNSNIQVEIVNGQVTLTPAPNWFGTENITFTATDDNFAFISDTVNITIINVDDEIIVTVLSYATNLGGNWIPDDQTINELDSLNFAIIASDPDGNILEYSWQLDGEEVSIIETYDFITNWQSSGDYEVMLYVTDNFETSDNELNFTWNVHVNDTAGSGSTLMPNITKLYQNYPNPFNPSTTIKYNLKDNSNIKIDLYNTKGQKISTLINQNQVAGYHSIVWDGNDDFGNSVSSGLYLYKLVINEQVIGIKKCLLLK